MRLEKKNKTKPNKHGVALLALRKGEDSEMLDVGFKLMDFWRPEGVETSSLSHSSETPNLPAQFLRTVKKPNNIVFNA